MSPIYSNRVFMTKFERKEHTKFSYFYSCYDCSQKEVCSSFKGSSLINMSRNCQNFKSDRVITIQVSLKGEDFFPVEIEKGATLRRLKWLICGSDWVDARLDGKVLNLVEQQHTILSKNCYIRFD